MFINSVMKLKVNYNNKIPNQQHLYKEILIKYSG